MQDIKKQVDELCDIKRQMEELKLQSTGLETELLRYCEQELENKKLKTIKLRGGGFNSVTVTVANNIKVLYPSLLKKIFGDCYKDVIKEETTYKLSDPTKRLLGGLYLRNYIDKTKSEVFKEIAKDDASYKLLVKKVKGIKFETDKKNLKEICGLNDEQAGFYAYFVQEAGVWENFNKLKEASNTKYSLEECLDFIDSAIINEETAKLAVDY